MIKLGNKAFEYGHYPDGTLNIKLDGFDPDYFTVRSDNIVHWYYDCEEELVAFSGDTLFQGSIGRTDLWLGSYDSIISSLRRIKGMLPPETRILPGHGPQTTMRQELEGNPFLR